MKLSTATFLAAASLFQVSLAFTPGARSWVARTAVSGSSSSSTTTSGSSSSTGYGRRVASILPARRKGDLFEEIAELEGGSGKEDAGASKPAVDFDTPAGISGSADKSAAMLAPEETFFEGPPSPAEMIVPAISVLTVIGIVPFIATVTRQFWVNYKFTSRRISVTSGFNGQDLTEVTYDEIYAMKFVYRNWGNDGDLVIELRDGAKLEMRSVPDFDNIYNFILEKCDSEVQEYSDKTRTWKKE